MYAVLADAIMGGHFGFLVRPVSGVFLAWRGPRVIYAHARMVAWGVIIAVFSLECPLTGPEDYFRRKAGQEGLGATGFIDTYLTGVIYPEAYLGLVRALVAAAVLAPGIGFAALRHRRARAAKAAASRGAPLADPGRGRSPLRPPRRARR